MSQTVVILGGGFGGVRCALDLVGQSREDMRVIIIDRNSHHLFTPSLYEVASAYPVPGDTMFHVPLRRAVAVPYREIFANKPIEMLEAEITSVQLVTRTVTVRSGESLNYDYCVLALGSQTADFGIAGVSDYAYQFKTIEHALAVNKKMHELFLALKEGRLMAPIKFLIIGAGFTGVELAAELATYAQQIARNLKIDRSYFSVILFEAAPVILPMIDDAERRIIMRRLTELGVVVMAGSAIESVHADSVSLKNGQVMKGSMVIWTAGVQPNRLLGFIEGLPLTDRGKLRVDATLAVSGQDHLFALGDIIEYIDPRTEKPIPGLAYTAKAQGELVALNIVRQAHGQKLKNYHPRYSSWIAPVGGKHASAYVNSSIRFHGFWGWLVRAFVDIRYLSSILPIGKAFSLFRKEMMMFTKND